MCETVQGTWRWRKEIGGRVDYKGVVLKVVGGWSGDMPWRR